MNEIKDFLKEYLSVTIFFTLGFGVCVGLPFFLFWVVAQLVKVFT